MNAYLPEHFVSPGLRPLAGERVALQGVEVDVDFHNLFCRSAVTQRYKNLEDKAIEAVYTFPLASGAVLLEMLVSIGARQLRGMVVEKKVAEERYEEALADGDGAIMLEQLQPGLYTMNVGNILAGEEVSVSLRYAELFAWQDGQLRFLLPTTIAPRYGSPEGAGLQPHQEPEHDMFVENRLRLTLRLFAQLVEAQVECPTHRISIERVAQCQVISLAGGQTAMDRDFVLNIRQPSTIPNTVQLEQHPEHGATALATFTPKIPPPQKLPAKSVKIVVDCSGSMNGDAITQARQAISDCLTQLRPEDQFNLVAFGSTQKAFFDRQVPATTENVTKIRRALRGLEADMGGTEMEAALQAAVQIPGPAIPQDILLITDGQIWQSEQLIALIKKANHRVFTVGVGSAVSEAFVRQLSTQTGGACELVVPNEDMAGKISRHFRRIFLPRAISATIKWPGDPLETIPKKFGPIFDGDTVHAFARFAEPPLGPAVLELTLVDDSLSTVVAEIVDSIVANITEPLASSVRDLARLAAWHAMKEADDATAKDLALTYQLLSPFTNILVIDQRPEEQKSRELPLLRKTPQMLAAGWGGAGTVTFQQDIRFSKTARSAGVDEPRAMYCPSAPQRDSGIRFSRGLSQEEIDERRQLTTPSSFMYQCESFNGRGTTWWKAELQISTYSDLLKCDLPDRILDALKKLAEGIDPPPSEEQVVLAFLLVLNEVVERGRFNRTTTRSLKKARTRLQLSRQLLDLIKLTFSDIDKESWG